MTECQVRRATDADAGAIAVLLEQLGYPAQEAEVPARLDRLRNVGRALVNAVEEYARESGCERLSVTTHEDRPAAHALYRQVRMEHTGRRFSKTLA